MGFFSYYPTEADLVAALAATEARLIARIDADAAKLAAKIDTLTATLKTAQADLAMLAQIKAKVDRIAKH